MSPLKKGSSSKIISANVREMIKADYPRKRAVAAAMRSAGRSKKK